MGDGVVHLLALLVQDHVREVVIFVNYQVQWNLQFLGYSGDMDKPGVSIGILEVFVNEIIRIVIRIFPDKAVKTYRQISITLGI